LGHNGVVTDADEINPSLQVAGERAMLEGWLEIHRATLLDKCEGLDPAQLAARSVPPSTLSLLGLVRHMSEVERHWFARMLEGERVHPRYVSREDPDGDFDGASADNAGEAFANFAADCDRSRVIAADSDLDRVAGRELMGGEVTLRWILVHMIEEYARHNGHADLLRECIDGSTG
jgi:uncharacterized damage-inducible protein DinB